MRSMRLSRTSNRSIRVGLLVAAGFTLWACSSKETPSNQAVVYTVKGRLEAVQPATNGYGILSIHHEAIADFRDESGAKVGAP